MRTLLLFLFIYNFAFSQIKKQETVEKKNEPIEVKTVNDIKVADADYYEETLPFAVVEQIPLFENCKNVEKKDQMNCFYEEMKKHVEKHLKICDVSPSGCKAFN